MFIPLSIKSSVLAQWLDGISRDEIALEHSISPGSVSAIIDEARSIIPDLDLMRELAVNLRKNNLTIHDLSSALRIHNRLNRLNLSPDLAESILEIIHVQCYVNGIEVKDFIELMIKQVEIDESLGIPITELETFVNEKRKHLSHIVHECLEMTEKRKILANVYKTTVPDLEEFQQLRPIHEKLIKAKEETIKKDKIIAEKDRIIEELNRQLDTVKKKLLPKNTKSSKTNQILKT
jgi:hypothetical protein